MPGTKKFRLSQRKQTTKQCLRLEVSVPLNLAAANDGFDLAKLRTAVQCGSLPSGWTLVDATKITNF